MDKKATLLPEETLKVIIAAICIVALIFLLVSLYFAAKNGENKKLAEASMKNVISPEITRINNGEDFNSQGKSVPNPTGWYVFSFVGSDLKPNLCIEENCVCICESVRINIFDWQKRQIEKCDEKGSCTVVSNLKKFDNIKIEGGGTVIYIRKVNGEIEITRK